MEFWSKGMAIGPKWTSLTMPSLYTTYAQFGPTLSKPLTNRPRSTLQTLMTMRVPNFRVSVGKRSPSHHPQTHLEIHILLSMGKTITTDPLWMRSHGTPLLTLSISATLPGREHCNMFEAKPVSNGNKKTYLATRRPHVSFCIPM